MRGCLSLMLALVILAAFGGLAFFLINTSGGAEFARTDQQEESSE